MVNNVLLLMYFLQFYILNNMFVINIYLKLNI